MPHSYTRAEVEILKAALSAPGASDTEVSELLAECVMYAHDTILAKELRARHRVAENRDTKWMQARIRMLLGRLTVRQSRAAQLARGALKALSSDLSTLRRDKGGRLRTEMPVGAEDLARRYLDVHGLERLPLSRPGERARRPHFADVLRIVYGVRELVALQIFREINASLAKRSTSNVEDHVDAASPDLCTLRHTYFDVRRDVRRAEAVEISTRNATASVRHT